MAGTFSQSGATGSNFAITRGMMTGFEVYLESVRFLGLADVELPDIKFKTTEIAGPGVMGSFDFAGLGHTDSLEITLNWRNVSPDIAKLAEQKAHDITLRASQQNYNQAEKSIASEAVRIDFRGIPKEVGLGKLAHVELTESKSVFEIIVLYLYVGGVEKIHLDKVNYIMKLNNVDYLKDFRANVGLSF